jgi:hypothetical protein
MSVHHPNNPRLQRLLWMREEKGLRGVLGDVLDRANQCPLACRQRSNYLRRCQTSMAAARSSSDAPTDLKTVMASPLERPR